ncbi:hypothetical protein [Modestobacter versicolor]|uniref:Uncharacterized protein n=1 Tax=Modestobacter versicolor TaxID=429133 RepID=A0A323VDG3_9ACTN|nr:hypothetical protein [Modestobacter versicolor]MBB3677864.1 hypothetical protein [Modestobacter versicolor]PZA21306.1 hypothetical protein DMO24_10945 [Modestobacter versicolor]
MSAPGHRRPWLYDPSLGGVLVRSHRSPTAGAAGRVVSDAVWSDVLALLRWAEATLSCPPELRTGTAWRTAATSAALLRRLPGLCREAGVAWPGPTPSPPPLDGAAVRLRSAADRLALRLCSPEEGVAGPLSEDVGDLARDVDEVGAAALAVLAAETDWTTAG